MSRKAFSLGAAALSLCALAGAAYAGRHHLLEHWHIRQVESEYAQERMTAIYWLGEIRSRRAVPVLAARLENARGDEALAILAAFTRMGPRAEEAVPAIIDLMKRADSLEIEGFSLIEPSSVERRSDGAPRRIPWEGTNEARSRAVEALASIGPPAFPRILEEAMSPGEGSWWRIALFRRFHAESVPHFLDELLSDHSETSTRAGLILLEIGECAVPHFDGIWTGTDTNLKVWAAEAVSIIAKNKLMGLRKLPEGVANCITSASDAVARKDAAVACAVKVLELGGTAACALAAHWGEADVDRVLEGVRGR